MIHSHQPLLRDRLRGADGPRAAPDDRPLVARLRFFLAAIACLTVAAVSCRPQTLPVIDVVELAGTPEDIGREHGARLGGRIRVLEERYLGSMCGDDEGRRRALEAARPFLDALRPHHRAELLALAESVGLPADRLLLANCFLDLLPAIGCATVTLPAEAAPDGVARFGRNLDFPGHGVAADQSLVIIVRGAGHHGFAAVTWPGLIGVLSGINEHGLTLANMEVAREPRPAQAMPYALLYRTILEECASVAEAVAFLEASPRQTANNLMLMDAGGERALVEIRPASLTVRAGRQGAALLATNHQRGGEEPGAGRCRRYDCIADDCESAWGTIDVAGLRRILARVGQGDLTLQSMIFEPASGVLHLAAGPRAAELPCRRIDLRPLLEAPRTE